MDRARASRTVEAFGWLDLVLGLIILITPYGAAAILHLPPLSAQDANDLRLVGTLVSALGMLYIVSGRLNSTGFAVASLLDRPLVPFIMAILWWRHVLPGPMALAFSISDFGGFLWTLSAWRADTRAGRNTGGPDLIEQTRAARALEVIGCLDVVAGLLILLAPYWIASLLQLPAVGPHAPNYFRLAGLLVGGLGALYFISGSLSAQGAVIATLFVRPTVAIILIVLWCRGLIAAPLALIGSVAELGGFLWTFAAWRKDVRKGGTGRIPLMARCIAAFFAFVSSLRNARTFHPDGRVFRGTVRSLNPSDESSARAAGQLTGDVIMRIGMGVMKKGWPAWLADTIPDAPSIASRFFNAPTPDETRLHRHPGEDLDLLCTAGGDRLWKLVLNLATGGRKYGLQQFDYFANIYYAQVPYRIDGGSRDVWIRLVPAAMSKTSPANGAARQQALTEAVANHATLRIEVQRAGDAGEPFVPIAEIRFEEEIEIDQETLHFDPIDGRGFQPHGFLTGLRKIVYPSSVKSRPPAKPVREQRDHDNILRRIGRYLTAGPIETLPRDSIADAPAANPNAKRRWVTLVCVALLALVLVSIIYLVQRFTRDQPVDYTDDEMHFMRGSTGGERRNGIPYWFWVALPEIFPELLPDKTPGRGYSSFGLAYAPGDDPKYALPFGVSMRNYRGIDVVYLNCGACHIGTVRDAPGGPQRIIPGMPAHQFDLGAFGNFLTKVPFSQKFTGQRMADQICAMKNDRHRIVDKPDWINTLIFKYAAVHLMREQLIILGQRLAFINTATWGPGRVDTFNAPKALLNFPMDKATPSELMGNVDFPSVWNQGPREGMQLHWDGNNTSVDERNLSAAFGTGAYPANLDAQRVLRMARYLKTAKPPPYPYPIDRQLASRGAQLYGEYCVGCHGTHDPPFRGSPPRAGEHVGTVVPIDDIATDRWRLDSYTWPLAVNQSTLYAGYEKDWGFDEPYPQRFNHFRKTNGYANTPLDGIWLRAPYLHNGSVPNLWELLQPAANRSKHFFNSNDVYDPKNVGFVSNVPAQGGHAFYPFDTASKGNGNVGHEDRAGIPTLFGLSYGTNLKPDEKWALIEYLKTF
jgi:hypothetical protein